MPNSAPAGFSPTRATPRSSATWRDDPGHADRVGKGFRIRIVATRPGAGTFDDDSSASRGGGRAGLAAGETIGAAVSLAGIAIRRGP